MFASGRAMKSAVAALSLATMLAWMPAKACAATGSVRITITRTQFIVGGGSGTLRFQGERYPLRVGGVSAGPFGAAPVDLLVAPTICGVRRISTACIRQSPRQAG